MANNKSKRSRSSSGQKSSSGSSFKPGDIFGGSGGGLVPVFAIVCGVLIGMGGAYVVKRVIFGGNKKRPDVAMIEEGDRVPGRSKLKREARIRPVETAEVTEEKPQYVEPAQPQMVEQTPAPAPVPEPRVLPRQDPLPVEPPPKHVASNSKKAHVPAASKTPIRVSPPPKPSPSIAMVSEPPLPEPVIEEPKVAPKFMTIRNLTYSRQLFNRCSEDCLLLFRSADGGAVKAKLKKSSFMRVLSNNLAYADIDGYESTVDGERVIVVKSIRGMPVVTPPPPAPKHEVTKPVKEEKVAEAPKAEKKKSQEGSRKKSGEEGEGETGDSVSLRNRLEGVSKAKKKDENVEESSDGEEEEGSSFQNRLKKSLD